MQQVTSPSLGRAKIKAGKKWIRDFGDPLWCQTALEQRLKPETESLCSSIFPWWGLKSRKMKPAGAKVAAWERKKKKKKGEEDQEGECSLICSLVDLQCAADLAGPLIACRCNNMDWSRAGVGGSAAHREDISTALPAQLWSAVCVSHSRQLG